MRIYTHRVDSRQQHSYIMGSETGGLGARLSETVEFNSETTTLEELRVNLEVFMDRGMIRRSDDWGECAQQHWPLGVGMRLLSAAACATSLSQALLGQGAAGRGRCA